ncbi:MAG: bifunctional DNase/RNase [Natronomonas sp.]|jgi:bifunctional DNase/RNase
MEHEATVEGVGVGVSDEGPGAPVVLLSAREKLIPIFVSADQAQSMQLALDGEPFERPLTHDLFVEMVAEFGAAIDRVRIDDLADGTFYAKIDTEQYHGGERKQAVFDARPSDGIALALRVDCPLIVSDEVIDEAGRPPDAFEREEELDDSGPDDADLGAFGEDTRLGEDSDIDDSDFGDGPF